MGHEVRLVDGDVDAPCVPVHHAGFDVCRHRPIDVGGDVEVHHPEDFFGAIGAQSRDGEFRGVVGGGVGQIKTSLLPKLSLHHLGCRDVGGYWD